MTAIGDLDGDGVIDMIVTEPYYNTQQGYFHVLFMNADGSVKEQLGYSPNSVPNYTYATNSYFGYDVDLIGDVDGDGVQDVVFGNIGDESVTIVMLNRDGTMKDAYEINNTTFSAYIGDSPDFGVGVAGVGDWNQDGVPDIAVGAQYDDDGGTNRGAVYVIYLNRDGSEKGYIKISDSNFEDLDLDDSDFFGRGLISL